MGRPGGGTAPIGVSVVRNGVAGKSGFAGASGNANRPGGFRARAPGPGGGHLGNSPWALRAALHTGPGTGERPLAALAEPRRALSVDRLA